MNEKKKVKKMNEEKNPLKYLQNFRHYPGNFFFIKSWFKSLFSFDKKIHLSRIFFALISDMPVFGVKVDSYIHFQFGLKIEAWARVLAFFFTKTGFEWKITCIFFFSFKKWMTKTGFEWKITYFFFFIQKWMKYLFLI